MSCEQPTKLQEICDSLGPEDIDRVFRKWLSRIPLPLRPQDRQAGFDWDLSIWQMEVSLTQIFDRRLLEVERVSHNTGLSGDSIQRMVEPAVTEAGKKAPGLKFGHPRVMTLLLALTLFQHLIDGFRNHDLRQQVADLLGVTLSDYTPNQMTYDLRRLRSRA